MYTTNKLNELILTLTILLIVGCSEEENKYYVGPKITEAKQVYGKYCDENCSWYINLNGIEKLSNISHLTEKEIEYSKMEKWDGYAYLVKGASNPFSMSDNAFIGFWRFVQPLPYTQGLIQTHEYPADSKGKLMNGVEVYIKWVPDWRGLESYIDGIYQLRYSPNGLDWYDEKLTEKESRLMLCLPGGQVKFERKYTFK
jgi:hypothetical protein